jgi:leucine efflux protein
MFGIENYGSFVSAILLFQLIPGAGTIAILNATARRGVGGGMRAVGGTLTGDFVYMLAAVLGLATLLAAYPGVLAGAQWLGAAYLCWIGIRLFLSRDGEKQPGASPREEDWLSYQQALAVSLTNPKVIMFFMAFFPLFLTAESTPVTLVVLMIHVTVISGVYQTGLVLMGNAAARRLSRWKIARSLAKRLAGAALLGFGIKLALHNR